MKKTGRFWPWLIALVVLLLIVCVAWRYAYVFSTNVLEDQEKWGQFGDYFGGVLNPLLSFFAFMALLFTLKEQKQSGIDSEIRHEEQQREQRFFQMMNLLSQVAGQVKVAETLEQGRDATHGIWKRFARFQLADLLNEEFSTPLDRYEGLLKRFIIWRRSVWPIVGNFVENFFTVYSYIYLHASKDPEFARFALGFIKANLSESERLLLWYAAICTRGHHQYCTMLRLSGFVDDIDGSLDDPLKQYALSLNFTAVGYWEGYIKDEKE
jgi:hypothetical protein